MVNPFNKIPAKLKVFLVVILALGLVVIGWKLIGRVFNIENFRSGFQPKKSPEVDQDPNFVKLEIPSRELPFFSLKSSSVGRFGILPQETLILTSREPMEVDFIKTHLETAVPVKLAQQGPDKIAIVPQSALKTDQTLKIKLAVGGLEEGGRRFDRDYSWAFQTQGEFRVINTLPGDKKTNIPLNTGIELTFSQDDYQDPKPYLRVEPSFVYRLERRAETLVVVPEKPLAPKTVYTITLRKGLDLKSRSDPLSEDYVFSFQTGEDAPQPTRLSLSKNFLQVAPQENLVAQVYTSEWQSNNPVLTKIYQFPSEQEFLQTRLETDPALTGWYSYYPETKAVPTNNLSLIGQADLKVQEKESVNYLQLPEPLPPGFYLIQFWYDGGKKLEQLWLQSTNLSGYLSIGKEQTVVWVNNLGNSQPGNSAKIYLVGIGKEYLTDERGIALFSTPEGFFKSGRSYLEITSQEQEKLILPVDSLKDQSPPGQETKANYWSYLYQERFLYKPNDTVYFWGVVKNRDTNQAPPTVKISLSADFYGGDPRKISQNIDPQNDGSFIGNFKLPGLPAGWYTLVCEVDGVTVADSWFEIKEYVKPEMKIEVNPDKKAVFTDEKVQFTGLVKFFDETPASQISLSVNEEQGGKTSEITANKYGEIKYQYQPKYSPGSYYPRYESVIISPSLAQSGTVEGLGSVYVFGSKLMITAESKQEENKAFIKGVVNQVDLKNFNSGTSQEVKGKSVLSKEVNLNIVKNWWEKVAKGTYYDFIEKTTRPSYDYVQHQETIVDKKLTTNDQGEISYQFDLEPEKSYETKLTALDEDQHPATSTNYFYYSRNSQPTESQRTTPQLNLNKKENVFSFGEKVELNITQDDKDYSVGEKDRFLFLLVQRGKQETVVRDEARYSFIFENKHSPNIFIGAIIFTGKTYRTVASPCNWNWSCSYLGSYSYDFNALELRYKKEDSQLSLEVELDKPQYRPAEEVSLSVKVTKDKQLKAFTKVNLVLVDEALAAIGGVKKPEILNQLYRSVPGEIYFSYRSHRSPFLESQGGGAERGGGGGERELFKDTAFFDQGTTDETGVVKFNFKLPDNITTWLVYTQAVTDDLMAADKESKLIVSKDFFVTSNFPGVFLEEDRPYLSASGFGDVLKPEEEIKYQAVFYQGDQEKEKKQQSGEAFKVIDFSFPKLNEGDYKVSLRGEAGNYKDGLILPFKVIKSRFAFQNQEKRTLKAGEKITALGTNQVLSLLPMRLMASDLGKGRFYWPLIAYCSQASNRVEEKLAGRVADKILEDIFEDKSCTAGSEKLSEFQNPDGGLGQVWWGSSDLETTVWSTFVDSEPFDKSKLGDYLTKLMGDEQGGSKQKILAAWGLTNLGQPQLNQLIFLAENAVTYQEKVLSALALVSAGEKERALEIYDNLLADYAYTFKPYLRIQSEPTEENKTEKFLKDTGLALLLGSLVKPEYDSGLYAYLEDYLSEVDSLVIDLGKMAFIREELSKLPQESTEISFESSAREITKDLSKGGSWAIILDPQEKDNFILKVNSGKSEVIASYFVGSDSLSKFKPDGRLQVRRSYRKVKGEGQKILPGDIIEIQINFDLNSEESPRGKYTITDYLPSGFTYLENPSLYGIESLGWVSQKERNVLEYAFYNSPWWRKYGDRRLVYYARANAVGSYVAEPAIIQSQLDPSVYNRISKETIKVESRSAEEL